MDVILIILGVLGVGAVVISAYVFTVAARNYVSSDIPAPQSAGGPSHRAGIVTRDPRDRRRGVPVQFPMTVNSVVVTRERRKSPDRRALV